MFQIGGLFFPDGENHFTRFGDLIHEYGKLDRAAAYKYVKAWRRVLDLGANVGVFARDFATRFDEVVAFEPMPETRECLALNVPPNVRIEPFAVADKSGVLHMHRTPSSGASFITDHPQVITPEHKADPAKRVEVQVRTIDSFEFDAVDLIKLDIQGAEYAAIVGARETILRHRPVLMVEQKPINAEHAAFFKAASKLLRSWGMKAKDKAQSDRIFVFED